MFDPMTAIGEVAARLVQEAVSCPQNDLAVRLRERAATLRGAIAALKRADEAAAGAMQA